MGEGERGAVDIEKKGEEGKNVCVRARYRRNCYNMQLNGYLTL